MSPTRRDLLKLSAGAVTAALLARNAAPAVAEPLIEAPELYVDEITMVMVHARLSDGRMASLAYAPGACQLSVTRFNEDFDMEDDLRVPTDVGHGMEIFASAYLHGELRRAGVPLAAFSEDYLTYRQIEEREADLDPVEKQRRDAARRRDVISDGKPSYW